jgi:hypothetical protein
MLILFGIAAAAEEQAQALRNRVANLEDHVERLERVLKVDQ